MNTNQVVSTVAFSKSDIEDLINEQVYWLTHTRPEYLGDLPKTGPVSVEYALNHLNLQALHDHLYDEAQSFIYSAIESAQLDAAMLVRDEYDTSHVFPKANA